MRWWPIVMLVACESASDFPGPPSAIEWSAMDLAVRRGTIDGTGYQIDLPAATERASVRSTTFDSNGLAVTIELDQEARRVDDIAYELAAELRDDGWSGTTGGVVYNYVYVDEGALLCKATAPAATSEQIARMQRICMSLRATTPLANPLPYPDGLAPSQVRAGMCRIALQHVRSWENVGRISKKRKTKQERAADEAREKMLDGLYSKRQSRCERERWPAAQTQCLVQLRNASEASECVPSW